MADQFIQVPPNSTGLKIDCTELTVGVNTVERERQNISDPTDAAGLAKVLSSSPAGTEYALVTRNIPSGTQAVSGTFFQGTQPVSGTVTANIGTTNGLALDATVSGLQVSQGSATAGEKGDLIMGAVTTGSPGYTTAQTSPLSLTLAGALRTDSSASTQPVSGTVSVTNFANPLPVSQSGTWTVQPGNTANTTAWKVDGSAVTQPVSLTSTTITGTVGVTQSTSPWVVSQGTASNLNATVVPGGSAIFEVSPTTAANTNANPFFNSITDGTTKATVIAATAALKTDLSSVAGTATVTAASGVQKVGITGNANATLDSTIGAATAPANALATSGVFQTTVPALTAGQAVAVQCDTTGSQYVNAEGRKATYRVATLALAAIASATAPTFSITGSASKTVKIQKIRISASAGTGGIADISLRRFSALSGGTSASQSASIGKMDSNNATATAVINTWSAAATTATSAGLLNSERYELVTPAVTVQPELIEWNFGAMPNAQQLTLRGTSEFAGVLFSAVGTTPAADIWIEWTEE